MDIYAIFGIWFWPDPPPPMVSLEFVEKNIYEYLKFN